jgi:DNA-binding MarR family transcriptional regulator
VPPRSAPTPQPEATLLDELLVILGQLAHAVGSVAEEHSLTPQQLHLLRGLAAPRPMHEVASEMCCDPSNVTGMIDRLEARGLVERTTGATDRRVKMLSLTADGRALRKRLEVELGRRLVPGVAGPDAQAAVRKVRAWLSAKPNASRRRSRPD